MLWNIGESLTLKSLSLKGATLLYLPISIFLNSTNGLKESQEGGSLSNAEQLGSSLSCYLLEINF